MLLLDLLVVVATGIAFTTYMLGVLIDPTVSIVVGLLLVGRGVLAVVPRDKRAVAATSGSLGVVTAVVVAPRFVTRFTGVRDELTLSLLLSGVVRLLTVALVHLTTFRQPAPQTN